LQFSSARILEASKLCPQYASMNKTIYSRQSECLNQMLVKMREKAGLNQRQLAEKLKRERSLIGRLELGERRLDVVEFFWICKACGINPETAARQLMRKLEEIQSTVA
jgi:ribosome-binding protein aMBF1 (putative translation factor)